MSLKIDDLFQDLLNAGNEALAAATNIANSDLTKLSGFSKRQLESIATLTATVATGLSTGDIPADQKDFELKQISQLTENFVRTIVGLALVTVEKIINAIVNVARSVLDKAVGGVI